MKFLKNSILILVGVLLSAICLGAADELQDAITSLFVLQSTVPTVEIVEVHPRDDQYLPEYVVIKAKGDYFGRLTIVGLGNGKFSKVIDVAIMSGENLLITDTDSYFPKNSNYIRIDSISLTDSGEDLTIQDSNGLILDSVRFVGAKNNESLYFNGIIQDNFRFFDRVSLPGANIDSSLFSISSIYISGDFLQFDLTNPNIITSPFSFIREVNNEFFTGVNVFPIPLSYSGRVNASLMFNNNVLISDSIYLNNLEDNNHIDDDEEIEPEDNEDDEPFNENDNQQDNNQDSLTGDSSSLSGYTDADIFTGINIVSSNLQISEINSFDGYFQEYLEIYAKGVYSGNITVKGLGVGQGEKSFFASLITGQYLVITDAPFPSNINYSPYLLSSISLTNDGQQLDLIGHGGQLLDRVIYKGSKLNKSNYFTFLSGSTRYFDTVLDNTPSYDVSLLSLFHGVNNEEIVNVCGYEIQNSSPIYSDSSLNIIFTLNGKQLSNSSGKECVRTIGDEQYVGCNPSYYKFASSGIFTLSLKINENGKNLCTSNFQLNMPQFISVPTCKEEYYKNLYYTWKDKYYEKNTNSDNEVNSLDKNFLTGSIFSGDLQIKKLLPNPVGVDKDNESIMIFNHLKSPINGDNYKLVYGKRSYKFSGFVFYPGVNNITGDFQFYNTNSCVELYSGNIVINSFCYKSAKEGIVLDDSTHVPVTKSPILNLKMKLYDDKSCVILDGLEHSCINLKFTKTITNELKTVVKDLNKEIKNLNSDMKKKIKEIETKDKNLSKLSLAKEKSDSQLILKYDKLKQTTDKKIESLKVQIDKKTQQYKTAQQKCSTQKESKDKALQETKVKSKVKYDKLKTKTDQLSMLSTYEVNYNKTIMSNLRNNWYVVYKESQIDKYEMVYKKYKPLVSSGHDTVSYLTMSIKTTDFKKLLDKELGKIGIQEIYNYNVNKFMKSKFYKNIVKKLNQLKKN